jgi:hypothetical protein
MAFLPLGPAQSQAKAVEEKIRIEKLMHNAIVANLVKFGNFIVAPRSNITDEMTWGETANAQAKGKKTRC